MAALTKFGNFLIDKGVLDAEIVQKATEKMYEYGDNSPSALSKILVEELKVSHDAVYEALAKLYAFPL